MEGLANIVNIKDVEEVDQTTGEYFGTGYKPLTPLLDQAKGHLGVNVTRVTPGQVSCPFHYHMKEDEVFYILSGQGVFRYGDTVQAVSVGDCISCPAGTQIAHQLANNSDEDLVYLSVGINDPNEVCVYPDSGKVLIRGLGEKARQVGYLEETDYFEGELKPPTIFGLIKK